MPDSNPSLLLFVCTGNTCRSPMAEVLAGHLCRSVQGWSFASAGLFAREGGAATEEAQKVLKEKGLDLSGHRSRQLSAEMVQEAEYLIGLTSGHAELMKETFPEAGDKIRTLYSFTSQPDRDVLDPFGGNLSTYRKTRDEIESALSDLILSIISPLKTKQEEL